MGAGSVGAAFVAGIFLTALIQSAGEDPKPIVRTETITETVEVEVVRNEVPEACSEAIKLASQVFEATRPIAEAQSEQLNIASDAQVAIGGGGFATLTEITHEQRVLSEGLIGDYLAVVNLTDRLDNEIAKCEEVR